MPVELRKRKAPEAAPAAAPPAKKKGPVAKAVAKVKEVVAGKSPKAKGSSATAPVVGDTILLENFGGEITTNAGDATSLQKLIDASSAGVVLFTYPKASTPGCTTQACLFRDSYTPLTATGFSIYGLSTDSPKANTNFKDKQKLPYDLLCDPSATLIAAIGLKKSPSGTQRGVFVVDKAGKVLASEPGSPAGTVEVVKKLVGGSAASVAAEKEELKPATNGSNGTSGPELTSEDVAKANVAAEVADTAEKIDSKEAPAA